MGLFRLTVPYVPQPRADLGGPDLREHLSALARELAAIASISTADAQGRIAAAVPLGAAAMLDTAEGRTAVFWDAVEGLGLSLDAALVAMRCANLMPASARVKAG